MSLRRILLVILFIMLGLAGAACALAIVLSSNSRGLEFSALVGFTTLLCGIALSPLVWLIGKPRFRIAACVGSAVVITGWLLGIGLSAIEGLRLYSYPYEIAQRIAGTLGLLILMGVPASLALLLASFRWARVAVWAFVAFAAFGFFTGVVAILLFTNAREWRELILLSGMIVYGIGAGISLLLLNAGCGDRRYFRWPAVALGLLAIVFSIALLFLDTIWRSYSSDSNMALSVAIVLTLIPMLTLAHTNLVLMAQLRRALEIVKYGTMLLGWAVGTAITLAVSVLILLRPGGAWEDFALQSLGVLLVVLALASLSLLLLTIFNRRSEAAPPPPPHEFTQVSLTCPRCASPEVIPTGEGACPACKLRIHITIIEPRCPTCGYNLFRINTERCPECGTVVNPRPAGDPPQNAFPVGTA